MVYVYNVVSAIFMIKVALEFFFAKKLIALNMEEYIYRNIFPVYFLKCRKYYQHLYLEKFEHVYIVKNENKKVELFVNLGYCFFGVNRSKTHV